MLKYGGNATTANRKEKMEVHEQIPLKNYTTMRLGGPARFMAEARTPQDLSDLMMRAKNQGLPFFILGGGSNTIAHDEGYAGLVIRVMIKGVEVVAETAGDITYKVAAGEVWDDFVKQTVDKHLTGIEALSGIPGTVGAAPVQNIGAYGQEVAETIVSVDAFDSQTNRFVQLTSLDCDFGYRDSIFRSRDAGRYGITHVTFRLLKMVPQPPFYKAVQDYLDERGTTLYTPAVIRDAVLAIRINKLPDPKISPNAGSFFKNALVDDWRFGDLIATYPDMPNYEMPGSKHKIPTGWLIEQTGLKGSVLHGIKVHDKNALVLINESATSYADLAAARSEIQTAVRTKFNIEIEQEPLEL